MEYTLHCTHTRRTRHLLLRDLAHFESNEDGERVEARRHAVEAVAVVPARKLSDSAVDFLAKRGRDTPELVGKGRADLNLAKADGSRQQWVVGEVGEVVGGAREERRARKARDAP